jgi:hypothetical protein
VSVEDFAPLHTEEASDGKSGRPPSAYRRLRLLFDVPTFLSPTETNPVTVAVTVNDAVLARLQFNTPGSKSVMTDCVSLDSPVEAVRVELTTNRSFVPHQIGLNSDGRVLALQLRDVEFHPEHACSASRR